MCAASKIHAGLNERSARGRIAMARDVLNGSTGGIELEHQTEEPSDVTVNDEQFIRDLKRLKELRSFLIQEAINISPGDSTPLSFGRLNLLQYRFTGRAPTQEEWSQVELHTQTLFRLLSEPLRRRFILGEIPSWVSILPILLALVALAALVGAVLFHVRAIEYGAAGVYTLPFYLVWLMCLGAIGSVAFIGMNALSVQQDITFDLTNRRLMLLRIALGALFGLVLTLPFGFQGFVEFIASISRGGPLSENTQKITVTTQAMLLLLPFILGFSTSLVIMILNRLVDAVQAFFGRTGTGERVPAPSAQSQAPTTTPARPRSI
jgi:hypothetical protein